MNIKRVRLRATRLRVRLRRVAVHLNVTYVVSENMKILAGAACLVCMTIGVANLFAFYLWWPEVSIHGIKKLPVESLKVARSLGRLDLISLWLTVLGIFLAIMALMGFNFLRSQARAVAEETARKIANDAVIRSLRDRKGIKKSTKRKMAFSELEPKQKLDPKTKEET